MASASYVRGGGAWGEFGQGGGGGGESFAKRSRFGIGSWFGFAPGLHTEERGRGWIYHRTCKNKIESENLWKYHWEH